MHNESILAENKKLWDAFKTAVGLKHDVTVEVPLRSTLLPNTPETETEAKKEGALARVCASARHLVSHLQPQVHA